MQAYKTSLEESPCAHFVPAVIISISYDEAGKHEEEVHCKIAVVDDLACRAWRIGLENVKQDHQYGGYASETV